MTQLDFEFLQRALGQSEDSGKLEITLGALPPDLPVTLPNLPDLRVLGGIIRIPVDQLWNNWETRPKGVGKRMTVRSGSTAAKRRGCNGLTGIHIRTIAPRWSFDYRMTQQNDLSERRSWRVFLDTSAQAGAVLDGFLAQLSPLGWQSAHMLPQVFVEAEKTNWLGVQAEQLRSLDLQARTSAVTQVWLTIDDIEAPQVGHFLGQNPHFSQADFYQASLPTLILPAGWQAQMSQGHGGPVHSQHYLLRLAEATPDTLSELWPHLLPQLERQGWRMLHRELHQEEGLTVYRTPLGVGTLGLRRVGAELVAHIVHVTDGPDGGRSSSFTISSGA